MRKIKSQIKKTMMHTWFGIRFIEPIYRLWRYLWRYRPWVADEARIKQIYWRCFRRELNLHDPRTFNEKLNWLKLHDRTDLHVTCSDKIKMREYVTEKVGSSYVVPLYFTTDNPRDINVETLPDEPVVVKTNHDTGTIYPIHSKYECNLSRVQNGLYFALNNNLYWFAREWNYKDIRPKILVEKMLLNEDGSALFDYKVYCMNGIPTLIMVDVDRFHDRRTNVYDTEWNLLDVKFKHPNCCSISRPRNLRQLLHLAALLSRPFKFVRVDLYSVNGAIFVGELTFFPDAGLKRFSPPCYDRKFGEYLQI